VGGQALADRYSYLPQTGIALALAWLAVDLLPPRREARAALAASAAAALLALGAATRAQLRVWTDTNALFRHALDVIGEDSHVEGMLAIHLVAQNRMDEAEHWVTALLQRDPENADAWLARAEIDASRGDVAAATAHFQKVLDLAPGRSEPHRWLGQIALARGELDAACAHLAQAVSTSIGFALGDTRADLGSCLVQRGRYREALPHLEFAAAHGGAPERVDGALALARAGSGLGGLEGVTEAQLSSSGLRASYAELLLAAGQREEAAAQMRRALGQAAREPLGTGRRAELRQRLGEIERAAAGEAS
jgi:Tfp pilus assembly protein PilF